MKVAVAVAARGEASATKCFTPQTTTTYSLFTTRQPARAGRKHAEMSSREGGRDGTRRQSTRNPRRRQRNETDSLGHQPRRKRSKIAADTFEAPTDDALTNGGPVLNGHIEPRSRRSVTPMDSIDIPLRSKKGTQKRGTRGDGSTIMVCRSVAGAMRFIDALCRPRTRTTT